MKQMHLILATLIIGLVGCGGSSDNNAKSGEAAVVADLLSVKTDGEGVFLRELPEPCDLLSEENAKELLSGDVRLRPRHGVSCVWQGVGSITGTSVSVAMQFITTQLIDSKKMSRVKLEEVAQSLTWSGPVVYRGDSDLGASSFVFGDEKVTTLVVLTGIGGTAVISDRIVSEAVLIYSLMKPGQTHEIRLEALKGLAKESIAQLTELAKSSHGASR